MNPVAIRLLNQQLMVSQFKTPTEVVCHMGAAHNNSGNFQPIIANDGIICGNWSPFREDCQADFFDGNNEIESLQEAWNLYQRFREK